MTQNTPRPEVNSELASLQKILQESVPFLSVGSNDLTTLDQGFVLEFGKVTDKLQKLAILNLPQNLITNFLPNEALLNHAHHMVTTSVFEKELKLPSEENLSMLIRKLVKLVALNSQLYRFLLEVMKILVQATSAIRHT